MKWVVLAFSIFIIILFIVIITRLTISFDYRHSQDDDYFNIKFTIWFGLIRFHYKVPMIKVETNSENPGIVTKKEMKAGKNEKPLKEQKGKLSPEDIINRMKDFNELLKHVVKLHKIIRKFLKKISILQFEWHSGIGTGNASQTGVLVGVGWALKSGIIGLLSSHFKLKCMPNISIHPYFQHYASETHLKCMIRFRIGNAMLAGIRLLRYWKGGRPHFKTLPFSSQKETKESL